MVNRKIIFHIDVNSAFLSWEAVDLLAHGQTLDIRTIPAVVGGDETTRHGIVLAKSIFCKPYKISTGESLFEARRKCPNLHVVPPRFDIYKKASSDMNSILREYSDAVQKYSIDESFVDVTDISYKYKTHVELGDEIRNRIKDELGFTVCVGISSNKLLAKMATDLRKPDFTNTLFPEEIEKMWCLPVGELFMVGSKSEKKLMRLGIKTIGDLAKTDVKILEYHLKSHGRLIHQYANGIENSKVNAFVPKEKGVGNSTTTRFDIDNKEEAYKILLALSEKVGMRLREKKRMTTGISVSLRDFEFKNYSHQTKFNAPTDSTTTIYNYSVKLFDEMWKKEKIRHFGIRATELVDSNVYQISFFDEDNRDKLQRVDKIVDGIRMKYGNKAVMRASFIDSTMKPIQGGIDNLTAKF